MAALLHGYPSRTKFWTISVASDIRCYRQGGAVLVAMLHARSCPAEAACSVQAAAHAFRFAEPQKGFKKHFRCGVGWDWGADTNGWPVTSHSEQFSHRQRCPTEKIPLRITYVSRRANRAELSCKQYCLQREQRSLVGPDQADTHRMEAISRTADMRRYHEAKDRSSPMEPVPLRTTWPMTRAAAGDVRWSWDPRSTASVRKAVAVSNVIFRKGLAFESMPSLLHARYPPCSAST